MRVFTPFDKTFFENLIACFEGKTINEIEVHTNIALKFIKNQKITKDLLVDSEVNVDDISEDLIKSL